MECANCKLLVNDSFCFYCGHDTSPKMVIQGPPKVNETNLLKIYSIFGIIGNISLGFILYFMVVLTSSLGGSIDDLLWLEIIPIIHIILYIQVLNLNNNARMSLLGLGVIKIVLLLNLYIFRVFGRDYILRQLGVLPLLILIMFVFSVITLFFHIDTVSLFTNHPLEL